MDIQVTLSSNEVVFIRRFLDGCYWTVNCSQDCSLFGFCGDDVLGKEVVCNAEGCSDLEKKFEALSLVGGNDDTSRPR